MFMSSYLRNISWFAFTVADSIAAYAAAYDSSIFTHPDSRYIRMSVSECIASEAHLPGEEEKYMFGCKPSERVCVYASSCLKNPCYFHYLIRPICSRSHAAPFQTPSVRLNEIFRPSALTSWNCLRGKQASHFNRCVCHCPQVFMTNLFVNEPSLFCFSHFSLYWKVSVTDEILIQGTKWQMWKYRKSDI